MTSNGEFMTLARIVQAGRDLSRQEMYAAFDLLMDNQVSAEMIADFLRALAVKGETVEEICGAADVMNEKVIHVACEQDIMDTCGTGGDGISTFNVSTTAAIIAAGVGAPVAKHGNRTSTRISGSAEAIAALGVNVEADVRVMESCLRECGIAFLYAPLLHPAMKHVAPIRKQLGIRTIFNLIGPLTNPAGAKRQLLGTCKPELTGKLAHALARRGATHAWVPHSHDGLCDLTVTGETAIIEVKEGSVRTFTVHPQDVGFETAPLEMLLVDSPEDSAAVIQGILEGSDHGPRRYHALLNAAAALVVAGMGADLKEGVRLAERAVDSGAALDKLQQLCRNTHLQA